jgi:hypothetical protein
MRRIPRSFPLRLLLLLGLLPGRSLAQEDGDASEGAPFLLLPVGAQAVAMGRAVTPLSSAESVFWNPAGLAELEDSRLLFYRADNVAGESTAASGLFSRPRIGVIGVTYNLLDVGEQDFTDEQNNVLGTISFRNHLAVASVATRFVDRVNVGVNFKIVQFRQSCRGLCLDAGVTATTYAVDAGLQVTRLAGLPLRLGAMIAHAGPRLQFKNEEQADPLPTRVRVGAAYEFAGPEIPSAQLGVELTAEVEDRWRDLTDGRGSPALYLGSEFSASVQPALLQLRAGYVIGNGEQVDGAAVGVGIRYNRFDLGIAKSLASNIAQDTEPVQVTFGLIF